MPRCGAIVAAAALIGVAWASAAIAGPGPSGSHYPSTPWSYGVACAGGSRIDLPDGMTSVFVYSGSNGAELCFQQRDAYGNELGPLSGRAWVTSDGGAHADAPGLALPVSIGDRAEFDAGAGYIRLTSYYLYGPQQYEQTTITPAAADGHVFHAEGSGSEYGFYDGRDDLWVGADGLHMATSRYRTDGYSFEQYNRTVDVDGNGVRVSEGDVRNDDFTGTTVAITPGGGLVVNRHQAGFDQCNRYGSSDQGVAWNPVGAPGSAPTVVDTDDHPPCP